MTEEKENIIAALRTCAASEFAPDCRECPYYDHSPACINKLFKDAAEALEALKAERDELTEKHWSECRQIAEYDDEARRGGRCLNEGLPVRT